MLSRTQVIHIDNKVLKEEPNHRCNSNLEINTEVYVNSWTSTKLKCKGLEKHMRRLKKM